MGTRSLTRIMGDGRELVTFYRQCDGYPSGIGADIKKVLNGGNVTIVNGYQMSQQCPAYFNGMGCLAAYLIGTLKGSDIGSVYIADWADPEKDPGWIEYFYTISEKDGMVWLHCVDYKNAVIYDGSLKDFDPEKAQIIANGDDEKESLAY